MAEVVIVRECKHGQVRVLFGNITTVEGDIMVIPANNRLAGREGLDERMQLAAGPELRDFCTNIAKERRKGRQLFTRRDALQAGPKHRTIHVA